MSPSHKAVIPAMAAEFGFDYEFVTYKWPHFLHKQARDLKGLTKKGDWGGKGGRSWPAS